MPQALAEVTDVQKHGFSGAPSGNRRCRSASSAHRERAKVWFCRAVDVADMGALLRTGASPSTSRVAVVGDVATPKYVEAQRRRWRR